MTELDLRPLEVFYDGSCGLCSWTMKRYQKYEVDGLLKFTDISDSDFNPERFHKTRAQFMDKLHVLTADGIFYIGVDAIAAIWRAIPKRPELTVAASVITAPGIKQAARVGYFLISKNRRRFVRRCEIIQGECDE